MTNNSVGMVSVDILDDVAVESISTSQSAAKRHNWNGVNSDAGSR